MDLEHLRQFLVLARTENMREAAEVLYISQPNLSRNLKALEAELGYPLFNRSRQRLSLNENGRQAQLCVQRIFQEIDKLQTMHRRTCERIPLSFIGKGSVYYDLLVPMLTNDLPEYEVSCITCSNQRDYMQAMRDTENGITYCTSGDVAELNPDFTYRYLMKDRICLSVPASCPLAARSSLRLDELEAALEGLPVILSNHMESSQSNYLLQKNNIRVHPRYIVNSPINSLQMLDSDNILFDSYLLHTMPSPSRRYIPLEGDDTTFDIYICYKKSSLPEIQAAVNWMMQYFQKIR